jgi:hypothetical protein
MDINMDNLFWFTADSDYGQVYVGIIKENNKLKIHDNDILSAMQMAMAMKEHELLIQEIEDWLNIGLKLQPVSKVPSSIHTVHVTKINRERSSKNENIILGFHTESLTRLPAPINEQLEKTEITTSNIPVKIILSEITIHQDEYEKLENGGILIIPDSYENEWYVKLEVIHCKEMSCIGVLRKDGKSIRIIRRTHQKPYTQHEEQDKNNNKNDKVISLTVAIQDMISIQFDKMVCWRPDIEVMLDQSLKRFLTTISRNKEIKASGYLISIANGYGIFLES